MYPFSRFRSPILPPSAHRSITAFTLVEVMVASSVLILAIVSALTTLQFGFRSLDAARNLPKASQIMQTELENLRLRNWDQLQALQDAKETAVTVDPRLAGSTAFACNREIRDIRIHLKEIAVTTTWKGLDGRPREARLITRYGKNGLNDYFYTAH